MELKKFTEKQKTLILKIFQGKEKREKTWVDEWHLLKEGIKWEWLKIDKNKVHYPISYSGYETTDLI